MREITSVPPAEVMNWGWTDFEPYYDELMSRGLTSDNVERFLWDWSDLSSYVTEFRVRGVIGTMQNVTDEKAAERYGRYVEEVFPKSSEAEQKLKTKILETGLTAEGFEMPLKRMRVEAELYREDNVPLLSEEKALCKGYDDITGTQTVHWRGEDLPIPKMAPFGEDPDREVREEAWRATVAVRAREYPKLDDLWRRLLGIRTRLADNAGLSGYREYRWRQVSRTDYGPEVSLRFHDAIEAVVVPAVEHARRGLRQTGLGGQHPHRTHCSGGDMIPRRSLINFGIRTDVHVRFRILLFDRFPTPLVPLIG